MRSVNFVLTVCLVLVASTGPVHPDSEQFAPRAPTYDEALRPVAKIFPQFAGFYIDSDRVNILVTADLDASPAELRNTIAQVLEMPSITALHSHVGRI